MSFFKKIYYEGIEIYKFDEDIFKYSHSSRAQTI